ncbi:hypothetical protein J6590_008739 [Homalodisca vitripennis]|nr:hypothetical protein J6590_008739 [Homalodisca vitripennis]
MPAERSPGYLSGLPRATRDFRHVFIRTDVIAQGVVAAGQTWRLPEAVAASIRDTPASRRYHAVGCGRTEVHQNTHYREMCDKRDIISSQFSTCFDVYFSPEPDKYRLRSVAWVFLCVVVSNTTYLVTRIDPANLKVTWFP